MVLLLLIAYVGASTALFWAGLNEIRSAVAEARFPSTPYLEGSARWSIGIAQSQSRGQAGGARIVYTQAGDSHFYHFVLEGQKETPITIRRERDGRTTLHSFGTGAGFQANDADPEPLMQAIHEVARLIPELSLKQRIALTLYAMPRITGINRKDDQTVWHLTVRNGDLVVFSNGVPHSSDLRVGQWQLQTAAFPTGKIEPIPKDALIEVPGEELMLSLAEAVRIAADRFTPIARPMDGRTEVGKGWMETRGGHRQLYLSGSPYEIGMQHGMLAGPEAKVMAQRLVYGVGLLYSIKQKEWFPTAAKKLVERQRPFIHADYFEEMRGLAEGAQMPLELVQMANIFPEFFHCSGVALMGEATKGGTLLHARVLDYMVGVGLQDYAAVMAVERPGKQRFVTVGYLGFIGSVTGMNEHQVAIGEMGGAGQGDWDGVPMSLLIRQALEECDTLEGVEKLMRESPRTCEYYYVVSDGKGPAAIGIAATPTKFETFRPGEFHERLQQPVEDAVLLSGPGRYEKLVERVQLDYGEIDAERLIEIIRRPVAMKSNLHNVVFEPQALRLLVADASRNTPACDEPYRLYTWDALFSAASSASPQ